MTSASYEPVTIAGKPVKCGHCGFGRFIARPTLMNTAGATFFGVDWANKEATALLCGACGHVEWFMERPVAP